MTTYAALATRLQSISRDLDAAAAEFATLDTPAIAELKDYAESLAALGELVAQNRRLDRLPPAQARVLTFVRQFTHEHGWPPTRKEIANALGFKSANGAHEHLVRLSKRGVLTLIEGAARGIRINKRGISAVNTTTTGTLS
jgi:sulfur relay (sulfurtransferase) DsrC/TusE family protein